MSTFDLVFCPHPEKFAATYSLRHPDTDVRIYQGWPKDGSRLFQDARHNALVTRKPVVFFWRQNWDRLEENIAPLVIQREQRRLWTHPGVREARNVWYIARPGQAFVIKGDEPPVDLAS